MKVKTVGLLFFSLVFLSNVAAMDNKSYLPKEIFKHWTRSHEEDMAEFSVFRPADYNFPPARGRGGFEIKEDGKFIVYSSGPDDRGVELSGYWEPEGKTGIIGYFEKDGKTQKWVINIITCSDDILKIKK